ncbi:ABC transporter ATP-binding protein [Paenibacillus filicis]|uniref:ABC transporter ATP-binding protein n=1 Tax=Paenibacillus filicis TaxID=669464 RepID=A0ABU9DC41_9BACL
MEIRLENVTKQYGNSRGIEHISLALPQGGFTAIVGPSGCGKTTLLRALAGFHDIDSGTIRFGERDVTRTPSRDRGATMVFQNYALWPHMSVFDNVAYGLKIRKNSKSVIEHKVEEVLRRVEIPLQDIRKRKPQHYSGGQQQRIALARALVLEPNLLLMDEPLSNLDAKVRSRLRVEIRAIQQSFGITALYVTHDQEEALSMADYVVIMKDGRIEQAGTPQDVYYRPQTLFSAQFMGESHTLKVQHGDRQRQLVLRSEDARLESAPAQSQPDAAGTSSLPGVTYHDGCFRFNAEVKEHLFIGSAYRYMAMAQGQTFFVDAQELYDPGTYSVSVPEERAYWFDNEAAAVR